MATLELVRETTGYGRDLRLFCLFIFLKVEVALLLRLPEQRDLLGRESFKLNMKALHVDLAIGLGLLLRSRALEVLHETFHPLQEVHLNVSVVI